MGTSLDEREGVDPSRDDDPRGGAFESRGRVAADPPELDGARPRRRLTVVVDGDRQRVAVGVERRVLRQESVEVVLPPFPQPTVGSDGQEREGTSLPPRPEAQVAGEVRPTDVDRDEQRPVGSERAGREDQGDRLRGQRSDPTDGLSCADVRRTKHRERLFDGPATGVRHTVTSSARLPLAGTT